MRTLYAIHSGRSVSCWLAAILLPLIGLRVTAQAPVEYDDVLLIINDASDDAKEIGSYFVEKRSIPENHVVHLTAPTDETVNGTQFEAIRSTVENFILQHNLLDSINYIVTTKGFPLRVTRPVGDTASPLLSSRNTSVESDLMLILGPLADSIGTPGWMWHQYGLQSSNRHFHRRDNGFFLVTRLDAYTVDEVKTMIDRSGPHIPTDKRKALFVLDQDPTPIDVNFHNSQAIAADVLKSRGWNVLYDTSEVYVTDQENVLGYASWGSNDDHSGTYSEHAIPRNTWLPGSLAETFVSTSGRSLMPGTGYGQSLIADWLAEGVVGAKGYVFEPFSITLAYPHVVFDRYTDESQDTIYNLAESFYMGSRTLDWMEVVLGDPKTSILPYTSVPPHLSFPDTLRLCKSGITTIDSRDSTHGVHFWFRGSISDLQEGGKQLDATNPGFIQSGTKIVGAGSNLQSGVYTYLSRNISGEDTASLYLLALPVPSPSFTFSTSAPGKGENVMLSNTTKEAGTAIWNFGDGSEPDTGVTVNHVWTEAGTYSVKMTVDNGGCAKSTTQSLQVGSTTGVDTQLPVADPGISLFPSPARNEIRLLFNRDDVTDGEIRIFGMDGGLVRTLPVDLAHRLQTTIELTGIPSGPYIIELRTDDGAVYRGRFVRTD